MSYEIDQETQAAQTIVRIALAYCDAQDALTGQVQPEVYDRQWQACCGVAARFLADSEAMTPQLCHHEWRLSQMRSSHPRYWPSAAGVDWANLDGINQYAEIAGLAAMRQALQDIRWEEDETLTEHLHPDAQQQHEIDNGWREE